MAQQCWPRCFLQPAATMGARRAFPISGRVTIDGAPLTGAFVVFYPPSGRSSNGRTDSAGRFTLRCFEEADGALLGTHQVTVVAAQELSSHAMKWFAPKKYANHKTSGLQYNVEGPTDDAKFELTWNGGKPFIEKANSGD